MKNYKQIFICSLLFTGCFLPKQGLIPTYNKGGYKIKGINRNPKSNDFKLFGKVFDVSNNKPLSHVELSWDCLKTQSSANGEYLFIIKGSSEDNSRSIDSSEGSYIFIEVITIGYKTILTEYINIANKNEINIDFYLHEDDRPLINCEGNIIENRLKMLYALSTYDYHKQDISYYTKLSWGGLESSSAYKSLRGREKSKIQNAIKNERYAIKNAKGTTYN